MMKRIAIIGFAVMASLSFIGCAEKPSTEEQIQQSITQNVHALTADE